MSALHQPGESPVVHAVCKDCRPASANCGSRVVVMTTHIMAFKTALVRYVLQLTSSIGERAACIAGRFKGQRPACRAGRGVCFSCSCSLIYRIARF